MQVAQCAPNRIGYILKNGLIGHLHIGLHEVSKYPCHATVGNKIGDEGYPLVEQAGCGAKENIVVDKGYIGAAGDDLQAARQQRFRLVARHQLGGGAGDKYVGAQRPDAGVDLFERQ